MRTLIAIAIFTYFMSACQDKNHAPENTLNEFREVESTVQNVVTLAAPHVRAVVDEVIKPAAEQVRMDAEVQIVAGKSSVEGRGAVNVERGIGLENTNATYCYDIPRTNGNIECFTEPQPNKERN